MKTLKVVLVAATALILLLTPRAAAAQSTPCNLIYQTGINSDEPPGAPDGNCPKSSPIIGSFVASALAVGLVLLLAIRSFALGASATDAAELGTAGAENRKVPAGFAGLNEFQQFSQDLRQGLNEAGLGGTEAAFQGSSVTGISYRSGAPFDEGRISDYDIALGGEAIFGRANEVGIPLRGGGVRTGPLRSLDLERLGLTNFAGSLRESAGRPVHFMVYQDIGAAVGRSPSIMLAP